MTNREYLEKVKGITDFHSFFVEADDLDNQWVVEGYCLSRKKCRILEGNRFENLDGVCMCCFNEWLEKERK